MDRVDADFDKLVRDARKLLTRRGRGHAADELEQSGRACIDHTRFAEDAELILRPSDRRLTGANEGGPEIRRTPLRLLRERPDGREDRPLDGLAQCAIRGVTRRPKRSREYVLVDRVRLAEDIGRSAHDLRQDYAGIPARAK